MKHWLYKSGWRLLPGLLAAGMTLMAARLGILEPLEHGVYRALFQVRGEQPWDERVAVIEIDEASLAAMGEFPWPRYYYTDLLEQLTPAESGVIAFDILFDKSGVDDADLAIAMARHGNVVLATAWDAQRGVIGPNADVMAGAIATGHIHNQADTDGITRTYQPKVNGTLALSIAAVQHYKPPTSELSVRNLSRPLWLNWRGLDQHSFRYSFVDVLTGKVPVTEFTNKIVFIGFTGHGLDAMATPYDHSPPAAGVYQHVVAANNLLAKNHLQPVNLPILIMFFLCSPVLSYWLFYSPVRMKLLTNLTILVVWGCVVMVAFSYNYWLPTIAPSVSIITTSLMVGITKRWQNRLKKLCLVHGEQPVSLALRSAMEPPLSSQ